MVLAFTLAAVVMGAALLVPPLVGDGEVEVDRTLDDVRVYDPQPGHADGDLDYPQSPSVGGLHNDVWLDCGVYDVPVPEEHISHDLEHGTVWITYAPGLGSAQIAQLAEALPRNGILSPYDDLRASVVVTVWGRQLDLTGADDPRLGLFIDEFGEGVTSPEPSGSCAGGAKLEQLEQLGASPV